MEGKDEEDADTGFTPIPAPPGVSHVTARRVAAAGNWT